MSHSRTRVERGGPAALTILPTLYGRYFRDKVGHGRGLGPSSPVLVYPRLPSQAKRVYRLREQLQNLTPLPESWLPTHHLQGLPEARTLPCASMTAAPACLPGVERAAWSAHRLCSTAGRIISRHSTPVVFPTLENSLDDYLGVFLKSAPFT